MTANRLAFLVAASVTASVGPVTAQSLPGTNLSVTVRVRSVTISLDTSTVSLSLLNGGGSAERLESFKVMLPFLPSYVSQPGPDTLWSSRKTFRGITGPSWMSFLGIAPGDSMPTLTYKAIGLPGIASAWYQGDSMTVVDGDDSASIAGAGHDPFELMKTLQTVGIDAAPTSLSTLVPRLKTLTDSSCALSWITNTSLCTALSAALGASPSQVLGYTTTLDSARSGGSAVTDAAYFMLKANAEYIKSFIDPSEIHVTYVCGNQFRIRNANYPAVPITYDYTGIPIPYASVTLAARTTDSPGYTDLIITPSTTGTVRVMYRGAVISSAIYGGTSC